MEIMVICSVQLEGISDIYSGISKAQLTVQLCGDDVGPICCGERFD